MHQRGSSLRGVTRLLHFISIARGTKIWILIASTCFSGFAHSAQEQDVFERVAALTRAGAPQLALEILERNQPSKNDAERWIEAEQLRLSVYRKQKNWQALQARLAQIPAELPLIQQHRLFTQAAEALVEAGYGADARRYLRELLWNGFGDSVQISYWRRLIIRSYLRENETPDALLAMNRYQQEYVPTDEEWTYILGLTFIKNNNNEQAAAALTSLQSSRGYYLRLLSRLRAGVDDPDHSITQANSLYKKIADDHLLRQRHWALVAEAAALKGDRELRVKALERLLNHKLTEDKELPLTLNAGDLWVAYHELAVETADKSGLSQGDDDGWLAEAEKLIKVNRFRARSIYSFVAAHAQTIEDRERLHELFYNVLRKVNLEQTAIALYEDKVTFRFVVDIPELVRHRIIRSALKNRNIPLAARMAEDLKSAYPGQDPVVWKLIRARLAIYSGVLSDGEALLEELIESTNSFDASTADKIMQLLFDLQNVGRKQSALKLFEMMHTRVSKENQKRETLFWMADVLQSLGKYQQAAEYYLRSAIYNSVGYDVWGQTARYQAAEALTQANLITDAREIYRGLLEATGDPKRAVNLERKLQGLWLREQEYLDAGQ